MEELLAKIPEAVRGQAVILTGRASDQPVAAGNARDLILVRTHGRTGVNHALLGSGVVVLRHVG